MQLPFTHDEFLDVFAEYNRAFWSGAVILWVLTLGSVIQVFRRAGGADRLVAIVLAAQWAWSGMAYHLGFFRRINPAATAFGLLFVTQAGLVAWRGVARRSWTFSFRPSGWRMAGVALIAYAMLYPILGAAFGLRYPRLPTVGVPCPTTILTAGFLLLGNRSEARILGWIPVVWAAIGGSAAFVLGIRADAALPVAGLLMLGRMMLPERRGDLHRSARFSPDRPATRT